MSSGTIEINNKSRGHVKHVTQTSLTRMAISVTCPSTTQTKVLLSIKSNSPTSVSDTKMPCHQLCEIRQLNCRLIEIKEEKIVTLRHILVATTELGRVAPHQRDEVTRNKRQIQNNLVQVTAELMYQTNEIARGCNPCQIN